MHMVISAALIKILATTRKLQSITTGVSVLPKNLETRLGKELPVAI